MTRRRFDLKKALIIAAMIMLMSLGVSAQDFTGEMRINAYAGYSLGFGDAFPSDDAFSFGPNLNFGGQFFYGWKENMMVGGELYIQNYKAEVDIAAIPEIGYAGSSSSDSEMKINILANILYAMNYEDDKGFFLIGGVGFYDYDGMSIGFNGGILYQTALSESITAFGMPRLHIVFEDNTPMMLQLSVGVTFPIGGGY